jgi:hypothetical protein
MARLEVYGQFPYQPFEENTSSFFVDILRYPRFGGAAWSLLQALWIAISQFSGT